MRLLYYRFFVGGALLLSEKRLLVDWGVFLAERTNCYQLRYVVASLLLITLHQPTNPPLHFKTSPLSLSPTSTHILYTSKHALILWQRICIHLFNSLVETVKLVGDPTIWPERGWDGCFFIFLFFTSPIYEKGHNIQFSFGDFCHSIPWRWFIIINKWIVNEFMFNILMSINSHVTAQILNYVYEVAFGNESLCTNWHQKVRQCHIFQ